MIDVQKGVGCAACYSACPNDVITMQELFTFEYQGENRDGTLLGTFVPAPVRPYFVKRAAYFGLERPLMAAMQG